MQLLRRLASTGAAVAIAAGILAPTNAAAATLTPQAVAGATPLASVHEGPVPNQQVPWRKWVKGDRVSEMWAHSPSMNRDVPLVVVKAASPNRPTVYLLNGGDGGEGYANWVVMTDVLEFYRSKDVNVVIPMAGKFSYYTDWLEDEPALGGKQRWETFLTKELPGPIEGALGANNQRAIIGMSMSATSSLLLAEHQQGFYDAVASFSGCASTSRPVTYSYLRLTLERGNTEPEKMWGPMGSPTNLANDAYVQAEKLRGTAVYLSNSTGLAGDYDLPGNRFFQQHNVAPERQLENTKVLLTEGGPIEAATNVCTHQLNAKLKALNIPADVHLRPSGTHSWGYWQDDLRFSWPTLARAFGIES